jgi:hypothetical protein
LSATINKQGIIASAAQDKLALDVLTMRKHWYPKWILFIFVGKAALHRSNHL